MEVTNWISLALSLVGIVVSVVVAAAGIVASVVVAAAGIVASYFIAKKYGDMAAQRESHRLHEAEVRAAKHTALRSLLTEVKRARGVGDINEHIPPGTHGVAATRLPVDGFATAFSAGAPGLSVGDDVVKWVAAYLAFADAINSLMDRFDKVHDQMSDARKKTLTQIRHRCKDDLPGILDALEAGLRQELAAVEQQLSGAATSAEE